MVFLLNILCLMADHFCYVLIMYLQHVLQHVFAGVKSFDLKILHRSSSHFCAVYSLRTRCVKALQVITLAAASSSSSNRQILGWYVNLWHQLGIHWVNYISIGPLHQYRIPLAPLAPVQFTNRSELQLTIVCVKQTQQNLIMDSWNKETFGTC